jgi:cation:H+ antiporter
MVLNIILISTSFVIIWFASRLIVNTVGSLSHLLHLAPFAISFLVLGLSTSFPEFFISLSSALDHHPEIFSGTLMGGSIALFLLVIPLLSILGGGIVTGHELKRKSFLFTLFVVFLPFLSAIDEKIERKEGIIMIISYFILIYFIEKKQNFFHKLEDGLKLKSKAEIKDFLLIALGAFIIFLASQVLVTNTISLASALNISPFLIGIIFLSLGADLPESAIAIISILKKCKTVALGDYLGSAAANTLIFGILTLFIGDFSFKDAGFISTYLLFALGLILFFFFAKSKKRLSRKEGFVLLLIYFLFIFLKISL